MKKLVVNREEEKCYFPLQANDTQRKMNRPAKTTTNQNKIFVYDHKTHHGILFHISANRVHMIICISAKKNHYFAPTRADLLFALCAIAKLHNYWQTFDYDVTRI